MESLTKFKLLFEKECNAMESFDAIERLLNLQIEDKKLKILYFNPEKKDFKPYLRIPLNSNDYYGDEYLNIFDNYIYYKIYSTRLSNIKVKPDYIFQSGFFFRNDENREYYDKIIDLIWKYDLSRNKLIKENEEINEPLDKADFHVKFSLLTEKQGKLSFDSNRSFGEYITNELNNFIRKLNSNIFKYEFIKSIESIIITNNVTRKIKIDGKCVDNNRPDIYFTLEIFESGFSTFDSLGVIINLEPDKSNIIINLLYKFMDNCKLKFLD